MNNTRRLRWGLLSTARISADVIPGLQRSSKNELVAVASRDRINAQDFAQRNNIGQTFGSYEALLDDPDIDCAYIPLPNHLHGEWTRRAVLAGKHVLCEKPFVADPSEATSLFTLADLRGVHLAEAFMYRHHPKTHALKQVIDSGELGEVHTIRAWFTYPAEDTRADIRFRPGMEGGALRDVGAYPVSMANYLLDAEPDSVVAARECDANGIDTRFYGLMRYSQGAVAIFDCSMQSHRTYGVTVLGSIGAAMLTCPWYSHKPPVHLEITTSAGSRHITPNGAENAYFLETENFADVVLSRRDPEISADETVRTSRTLARLHRAAS
ncbi:Gfo/Idh/MocA family protein [Mycolicibacterium komossense]|uniref:Gfo/Idh/MocA family oxidoreductase n=1 Tax=Mycolicibacterium komossense TaxID=1779 RepID=A0ABT3C5A0_9MYCO|nr:Gfo/Idh/MocA family oxidoreductase [Mycolicibacterium komossense]MCV7224647.1 Gfo/Idh/MocA family oxidoreductase [Mycolicibacterium komossense]